MRKFYSNRAKLVFLIPGFALFSLFVIYAIFPCFIMSLQNHNGVANQGWVGFLNYKTALTSDVFWSSHIRTYGILLMELLIGIPVSLLLALMLDRTNKVVRNIFKFAALFPSILSVAVIGKMFLGVFNTDWGIVNTFLRAIGLDGAVNSWLSNPKTAMICIGVAYVWQYIGYNAILFYTGLKSIPPEFYEAATLDGANFFQISKRITIPLLQDMLKYVLTGATTGTLGMYGLISVMTAGGPGSSSRTVLYEMYYQSFQSSRFGYGCAIALLFLIECIVWACLINRFVAHEEIKY
ncbi:MAG: sugar ABC transporter permease [Lachnospiraceae bacterium]|nr:sugar ABC transporter permease [Lachnospiraceae bacterium]